MNNRAKTFIARSSVITILLGAILVCGNEAEAVDDLSTTAASTSAGLAVAAANPMNECLYYDVHKQYKSRFWGKTGDDRYPMNGKTPTRVDLEVHVKGHGNATLNKQDSTEVVVHYWYDLFTKVTYDLKVWVEC